MIDLTRDGDVFVLTMNDGENRWTTTFAHAFAAALDTVEVSEGPAALVTTGGTEKFYSNGLDLEWRRSDGDHPGGDRAGHTRRYTIGRYGSITVEEARKQAKIVLGAVAKGDAPSEERASRRRDMTVTQLIDK